MASDHAGLCAHRGASRDRSVLLGIDGKDGPDGERLTKGPETIRPKLYVQIRDRPGEPAT